MTTAITKSAQEIVRLEDQFFSHQKEIKKMVEEGNRLDSMSPMEAEAHKNEIEGILINFQELILDIDGLGLSEGLKERYHNKLESISAQVAKEQQRTELALFRKSKPNVSLKDYFHFRSLENRVLVLGCGHTDEVHSHVEDYCVDDNKESKPDQCCSLFTTAELLTPESFSKIILEKLPEEALEDFFSHLYRILPSDGKLELVFDPRMSTLQQLESLGFKADEENFRIFNKP